MFDSDREIFEFVKEHLYVAAVCDMLDSLGYRNQAMHQRLRPLLPDIRNCGFVGRARTVRWMEVDYVVDDDPYGLEIEIVDSLRPGDVIVHSTDHSGTNAPWGELLSTVAPSARFLVGQGPRHWSQGACGSVEEEPWMSGAPAAPKTGDALTRVSPDSASL